MVPLAGMPRVSSGMKDDVAAALFAVSGAATPSTAPWPNRSGGFDPGPLVLAFVLGELLEDALRRSLLLFDGDPTGFFTRPISGTLLVLFLVVALLPLLQALRNRRRAAPQARQTKELV